MEKQMNKIQVYVFMYGEVPIQNKYSGRKDYQHTGFAAFSTRRKALEHFLFFNYYNDNAKSVPESLLGEQGEWHFEKFSDMKKAVDNLSDKELETFYKSNHDDLSEIVVMTLDAIAHKDCWNQGG